MSHSIGDQHGIAQDLDLSTLLCTMTDQKTRIWGKKQYAKDNIAPSLTQIQIKHIKQVVAKLFYYGQAINNILSYMHYYMI